MAYEQFQETIRERLQALLGPSHTLSLRLVPKNNGVELTGISDSADGSPIAPTVYLNSYYIQYMEGVITIDDICAEILSIFMENPSPGDIRPEDLADIEKMSPLIMMRLIHRESNRTILADVPYLPYLDLAIVFYLSLCTDEKGQMTILISRRHMEKWELNEQDLLRLALENTPAAFPAQIHSMMHVLKSLSAADPENGLSEAGLSEIFDAGEDEIPLYVLTNSSGIYGAACMLYRNTLKNFAGLIGCDLIIIPSSVHEVLLTPFSDELDLAALDLMVKEVNRSEVSREERLSDHIYLYSRKADDISVPVTQSQATYL